MQWSVNSFTVSCTVINKLDGFQWMVVAVYGSAYEELKQEFIDELHLVSSSSSLPMLFGGDFNLVREASDKNNGNISIPWATKFNDWINNAGLMELKLANRQFTWCNNQSNRIMASLDRVFMTTCWEAHHPAVSLMALPRIGSDHTPLVIQCGGTSAPSARPFRFEKWWLSVEGFVELVKANWNLPCPNGSAMDTCQFKIRRLRKFLRGWNRNVEAEQKINKKQLFAEYNCLDIMSETTPLLPEEVDRMKDIKSRLSLIWKQEETKIRQRSRERDTPEGDKNTAYFQALANQRKRKKKTVALEGPSGLTQDNNEMLQVAADLYKNLFGKEDKLNIHLCHNFWEPGEQVTAEENELLDKDFTEEEVREAVFQSYAEGAPGPDGFSFIFYQKFWDAIKLDLMALFRVFDHNQADLFRLNFAMLTLIPKEADATSLKKYRPIALANCSFNFFAKACTNRLGACADRLISENHTAFIKGRFILESVVSAHEIIHELHRNKEEGVILKLDYEKAYDRVD